MENRRQTLTKLVISSDQRLSRAFGQHLSTSGRLAGFMPFGLNTGSRNRDLHAVTVIIAARRPCDKRAAPTKYDFNNQLKYCVYPLPDASSIL